MSQPLTKDEMSDYAIALQRAIEYHCKGQVVPERIGKEFPYHAKMLNRDLAKSNGLKTYVSEFCSGYLRLLEK